MHTKMNSHIDISSTTFISLLIINIIKLYLLILIFTSFDNFLIQYIDKFFY